MSLHYLGNQVPRKWVFLVMLKNDTGLVCCIFNTHRPILIIFCTQQDKPNFWVHVSPGSADTLARGGGITNHRLVAFSLGNISAKNYQNRLMCVEVIVCYIIVVFFETQCNYCLALAVIDVCCVVITSYVLCKYFSQY